MNQLKFYKHKSQRIKSGALFGILLIASTLMVVLRIMEGSYFTAIIFLVATTACSFSLISIILNKPTVIIDSSGIRNKTNMMGLVKWEYIDDFEIKTVMYRQLLVIKLNNQEAFLNSKNLFSKTLMKTNINSIGSPVAIGAFEFDEPLEIVLEKIISFRSEE
jgi:hypothetical protein